MLSCFSVRLRLWDAGLTWPEWDITQNMNLPIIMFIPHVHVCVQGHDHVCTSLDEHEIHSKWSGVSHLKIRFSIYIDILLNARILLISIYISHGSRNISILELTISSVDKWHVIKVNLWNITQALKAAIFAHYASPLIGSKMSWGHNIRQLFGRKYLTILIAYPRPRLCSLTGQCEGPLGALSSLNDERPGIRGKGLKTPTTIVNGCSLNIRETRQRQEFLKTFPSSLTWFNIQNFVRTFVPSFFNI